MNKRLLLGCLAIIITGNIVAQNPIIRNQFSADPSARAFEGKIYLYPSHDIPAPADCQRKDWFCMADYHVFSSDDLIHWKDYGVIFSQDNVPWVKPKSYGMWAPDCIFKNGKYYFYFPATPNNMKDGSIGVAISDHPSGPFTPEPLPIKGTMGIDPCPFIDKDGQAYLYYAAGNIYVAKLKDNMTELAFQPQVVQNLPKGFKEGPFFFERDGYYYLTYPLVLDKTETLAYSIGKSPMGPFEYKGLIMDESSTGCWTNHHSVVEYKGQWYLFYHNNYYSPKFDKNRSVCADSLFFNADGTIRKVIPTFRGVGITSASDTIHIDRYSKIGKNASIAFLDDTNTFGGWKTCFNSENAWIQYNTVDFGKKEPHEIIARVSSQANGVLLVHIDNLNGPVIAQINVTPNNCWTLIKSPLMKYYHGIHNLYVVMTKGNNIDVNWLIFK
jgi:hypothetical protein